MNRTMMFLLTICFWNFCAASSVFAARGALEVPQQLIDEALINNPQLLALQSQWQMAEHKVIPAQALDDPQLSLALSNYPVDTLDDDWTAMTGKEVKLSQKFPFPGKRAARGTIAQQQALWFKGVFEDQKLRLTQEVKEAYYELYYQRKALAITKSNLALLDDVISLIETRYQLGKGLQQDVLKAQVERSKLMDQLLALTQREQVQLAQLNSLLNRPTSTLVEVAPSLPLHLTPSSSLSLDYLQQAIQQRPLSVAYTALLKRYRSQKSLAKLNYRPDFTVGVGYRQREANRGDDGTDFVGAELRFNLPINQRWRGEAVAEAQSGLHMVQAQFDNFRRNVLRQIHDSYSRLVRYRQREVLYRTGLLPQAQQNYQAALAAYQVDKVDFLTLLDSLLSLQRYELDYYRALSDHQRSLAQLEALTGQSLAQIDQGPLEKMP